jgi:transcription elongation factor GreA
MAEAITAEGLEQLKAELAELEGPARRTLAAKILAARELGDLSENAEYHAAKEEQAHLETKILRLIERLRNATVVEADYAAEHVTFGATVDVLDVASDRTTTYTIVGPTEADVKTGKLSAESPVAQAILGAMPGETVSVETPSGPRQLKIVKLH